MYLYADGSVRSCGRNKWGQLGDGTTIDSWELVSIAGLEEIVNLAHGGHHSLAIASDGTLFGWGRNKEGELCAAPDNASVTVPQVINIDDVTEAAAGDHHTLLLRHGRNCCDMGEFGPVALMISVN